MSIKMIVTDLDGTLLRDDKTISERTLSALERCRNKGIKVAYATGRGASTATIVPHEFFDGYAHMNGAKAYVGDELVYNKTFSVDDVREMLVAVDDAGFEIVAESGYSHYSSFDFSEKYPEWNIPTEVVEFKTLDAEEIEKLYAPLEMPEVEEIIRAHLADHLYVCITNDRFAMVMNKDATKSKATASLAEIWGIKQDEIVGFGDDTNDIDLLEWCGIGVAMGNAFDGMKAIANQICDTNENDGIAKWLEENVLEK